MMKTAILLADGVEEVEALTVVDLLRRESIVCDMVSIADKETVTGSHGIVVQADRKFSETDFSAYGGVILPGGQPGTTHLGESEAVLALVRTFAGEGKLTAAICAAPTVLGKAGILAGKRAVCYPGLEGQLTGAEAGTDPVMKDGNVITSRGMGTAIEFGLALVREIKGAEASDALAHKIVYR